MTPVAVPVVWLQLGEPARHGTELLPSITS